MGVHLRLFCLNPARDITAHRQSTSNGAFLLKENLKTFAHTFRVNERLELEACPNTLRLGLPFVIEVGEELSGVMAVIDGEHVAAFEAAADFRDPVAGFESRFGVLPLLQDNALRREIFGNGASRERRGRA